MRKYLLISFIVLGYASSAQLTSLVVRSGVSGDTLYNFNPSTGTWTQLTKLVPTQAGQAGKFLSTNGSAYTWAVPDGGASVWGAITGTLSNQTDLQNALDAKQNSLGFTAVPNTRTINGQALSGDITIAPAWADVTGKPAAVTSLSGTNTGDQTISDATITTTDIVTNDVSTSKHGFAPKGNGSAVSYLNGNGTYSTPANTNSTISFLSGNVINNNASANTIADVTGLSFPVVANSTYRFKFFIVYTSAATTTGSRWSIAGPATTFINYNSSYTLTATSQTVNSGVAAYNSPSGASASSLASGNIAIIEGIIRPSANGTVIARFASEISASAITAIANQSWVEYQIIN